MIYDILVERYFRVGREPIAQIMFHCYGYSISGKQICRIMRENHLSCEIRLNAWKPSEKKDTTVNVPDLVTRDYNNKNHSKIILATDVTYIPATSDGKIIFLSFSSD